MNNPVKVTIGMLIGAGIGMGISRAMERADGRQGLVSGAAPKETFKEKWERAQATGEAERAQTEEQLRRYFRGKVNDPTALRSST